MQITKKEYASQILQLLKDHYPQAKMILKWSNNFELLIAIILSAQCTDLMVKRVTEKLFPKYKKVRPDLEILKPYESDKLKIQLPEVEAREILNFAYVPIQELEADIKSTGFYRNKAKNIKGAAKSLIDKYQGNIPKTISQLLEIPGVGRKTANVFLGNAYKIYEGIAVDTHVRKQAQLLNLTKNSNPEKIEQDLMCLFDKKEWFTLTYLLIEHGRNMRRRKKERRICSNKNCLLCSPLK